MRVLLVNTNLMKPPVAPIGLDYLADSIRAAGHEPRLLDLCFSAVAGSFEPDVIGVSVRNTDDCYFASGAFFLPGIREVVASLRRASEMRCCSVGAFSAIGVRAPCRQLGRMGI